MCLYVFACLFSGKSAVKVLEACRLAGFVKFKETHLYRTNSHAGFPKGSYTIPNPVHYHIARYKHTIPAMRPALIRLTQKCPTIILKGSTSNFKPLTSNNHLTSNRHHHQKQYHENDDMIKINIGDARAITLNVSLHTLKEFIMQFATALNLIPTNIDGDNKSCQTSYVVNSNSNQTLLNKSPLKGYPLRKAPVNETLNEVSSTNGAILHAEVASNESALNEDTFYEESILDNVRSNLMNDFLTESENDSFEYESSSSESIVTLISERILDYVRSKSSKQLDEILNELYEIYKTNCPDLNDIELIELKSKLIDSIFDENSSRIGDESLSNEFDRVLFVLDKFFDNVKKSNDTNVSTDEEIVISFKSNQKKRNESFWFAVTKSPVKEVIVPEKREIINVDDIPLKPPPDLFLTNKDDNSNVITNDQFQFYRTQCDASSYTHETNVTFLKGDVNMNPMSVSPDSNLESDEGDWMGYEGAKF